MSRCTLVLFFLEYSQIIFSTLWFYEICSTHSHFMTIATWRQGKILFVTLDLKQYWDCLSKCCWIPKSNPTNCQLSGLIWKFVAIRHFTRELLGCRYDCLYINLPSKLFQQPLSITNSCCMWLFCFLLQANNKSVEIPV